MFFRNWMAKIVSNRFRYAWGCVDVVTAAGATGGHLSQVKHIEIKFNSSNSFFCQPISGIHSRMIRNRNEKARISGVHPASLRHLSDKALVTALGNCIPVPLIGNVTPPYLRVWLIDAWRRKWLSATVDLLTMENVVSSPGVASKSCVVYETSPPLDALKNVKFPIFQ